MAAACASTEDGCLVLVAREERSAKHRHLFTALLAHVDEKAAALVDEARFELRRERIGSTHATRFRHLTARTATQLLILPPARAVCARSIC